MKRSPFTPLAAVLLGALALTLLWALVDRPLAARLVAQEVPLADLRGRLTVAAGEAGLTNTASPARLAARLAELQAARGGVGAAVAAARERLRLAGALAGRVEGPFQLVEFQNELQRRIEELGRTAGEAKVVLEAAVAGGFPRYAADFDRPELHWVQLELITRLVRSAILARVGTVHQVAVPPVPARPLNGSDAWQEVRAFIAFTGPAEAALEVISGLTLLPEEAVAAGVRPDLAGRPVILLEHLLVRRTALERPDEVRTEIAVALVVPAGEDWP